MKNLSVYLHFSGDCREALEFYKEALGGEIKSIQTYGEANMAKEEAQQDKILHAEFQAEDIFLMAADGMHGQTVSNGNNISLSINLNSEEEQSKIFNKLAEGGQVTMPLEDTFWGARFGMLTDRFGTNWMLNCNKN